MADNTISVYKQMLLDEYTNLQASIDDGFTEMSKNLGIDDIYDMPNEEKKKTIKFFRDMFYTYSYKNEKEKKVVIALLNRFTEMGWL